MTASGGGDPRPGNPFSARNIRPGAIPYFFAEGQDAGMLLERLQQHGWFGQIVGPHGSGKSALLAALIPSIEASGRRVMLLELHDGARRLPIGLAGCGLPAGSLLAVDGYEQLTRWNRWRVRRYCRRHGLGLLVTAHASVGLPELAHTRSGLGIARRLVDHLLGPHASRVSSEELQRGLALHEGNLRELLFDLYDRYETITQSDYLEPER